MIFLKTVNICYLTKLVNLNCRHAYFCSCISRLRYQQFACIAVLFKTVCVSLSLFILVHMLCRV